MNIRYWKPALAVTGFCFWNFITSAQLSEKLMQQHLSQNKDTYNAGIMKFYEKRNYQTAWILNKDTSSRSKLLSLLKGAAGLGLTGSEYMDDLILRLDKGALSLNSTEDSITADVHITMAALRFYEDLAYGNGKPPFGYEGLKLDPDPYDIPALVAEYNANDMMQLLRFRLSPTLPEIAIIENKLQYFNQILSDTNFQEVKISSNKVNKTNRPLAIKLHQLGILAAADINQPDSVLVKGVKEAQKQFGLLADGVLRSSVMEQLNVPLMTRMKQLSVSLNYYRWLGCIMKDQSLITVNLPAAYMKVYRQNSVILEMRMIVGKKSTPTPTLTGKINEVILYPYWHVPKAIAINELLPKFRKNIASINEGNYQVLNRAGKIVDPSAVNWQVLNRNNFPYIIRQSTGCDNALGLLKLNFYNPFDVYLHDTNGKSSFMLNRRFLSHGCMRMEKPMELGRIVLANNSVAIDTLEQKGCLRNQAPIAVPARVQIPVIVWYNPAGIDSTGRVLFFEDIYDKFSWMKNK